MLENKAGRYDIGDIVMTSHSANNRYTARLNSSFANATYSGTASIVDFIKDIKGITIDRELPALTTESLMDMLIQQAEIACLHKGEKRAIAELRKHTLWYLGNLIGSKTLKVKASMINSLDELKTVCCMAIHEGLQPRG
jgi:tRNA-dihydrouridine synthase